jgi:Na+/H+ antiporter NhaD/arsenite permease-like protein
MHKFRKHINLIFKLFLFILVIFTPVELHASQLNAVPSLFGIRFEFVFFILVLIGVALFSKYAMQIALGGLLATIVFKIFNISDFSLLQHFIGSASQQGEWNSLLNLAGLLFGFSILAKHFEESKVPDILPDYLPNDWKGGFMLLVAIMVISSFLDNIAAAMIGGAIAMIVFKGRVHIGYLAAIVAASNAGGAGSVVGDTTTTLMWIDGVAPLHISRAFIASIVSIFIFGIIGSIQQDKYQRIQKDATVGTKIIWGKLAVVLLILFGAIITNWLFNFPALGVWLAIFIGSIFLKTPWKVIYSAVPGTIFLLSMVTCASLMPVEQLPKASWQSSFTMGFVSAVFDNIPLTKLCLVQGGYDWGILAFAVGFGGSMIWFGSSAGVALSNIYPEAKNVVNYVKSGWHVTLAYVVSFFIMLSIVGWHPHIHKTKENLISKVKFVASSKSMLQSKVE